MSVIGLPDLDHEATLDPQIQPLPEGVDVTKPPRSIFLTGATGFVAAYVLADLIDRTQATIYALVRASNEAAGMERIRKNLEHYRLRCPEMATRIKPVAGDLKQPLFGLPQAEFNHLAEEIDVIFHVGSKLSYIAPYHFLKDANVGGTQETLRLATTCRPKPYHFVSSLGILLNYKKLEGGHEEDELDAEKCPEVGYFQTKYVAERVVRIARARGIPVTIHRIGLIVGDSERGYSNTDDFVARILIGCIQAGYGPDIRNAMDMTPVDFIARAIVYLAFQPASLGHVFHLLNPAPITWGGIIDIVNEAGYRVEKLPFHHWIQTIEEHADPDENPLHPLLPFFHISFAGRMLGINENAYHALGTADTQAALAGSGIHCPPVDEALINTFLMRFVDAGRLHPAPQWATSAP
ncbi:MAG: thioester reductase domain-containing protein [Anaerolineae bacterium]|nr:thioester reductase domain-containing protein [Anaerolineae bacterium]